jgi:signal transduction histidine kinase
MRARKVTFRYVGALVMVAGLLVAGQIVVQYALDRQEGDARVVNQAGRQRMLGQRLCMLLLAIDVEGPAHLRATRDELARVAEEWQHSQAALRAGHPEPGVDADNSAEVDQLFAAIEADHRAMLAAARAALELAPGAATASYARTARAHQDAFLAGMDRIVLAYERAANRRIVTLRRIELARLALVLLVLVLEGAFVFRPAVRGLRDYLAARDAAERATGRERQLLQISDREQMRLAHDLHDGLSQHLIGIAFLLRSLRRELTAGPQLARIDDIDKLLGEAIEQARGISRGLHSHTLEASGLAAALGELAAHTERVFGVMCRVTDYATGFEPPAADRTHLHRIAREAIVNAAKHASATAIEIELARDAANLTLTVRDDGIGIAARPSGGLGLHLMAYRARMMGASLDIAAGEHRGTTVICRLPLRDAAPGAGA